MLGFNQFQSTRPARGATREVKRNDYQDDVSIHAPRTGRDLTPGNWHPARRRFNPRAPHGARHTSADAHSPCRRFQSTRPARGATEGRPVSAQTIEVSIHAPRTGRDHCHYTSLLAVACFNPRAPHGARPLPLHILTGSGLFQSTRPARGATLCQHPPRPQAARFNPRAPHGARRHHVGTINNVAGRFNPRAPHGARHAARELKEEQPNVSIHAPRTGRDRHLQTHRRYTLCFNPRAPHGARLI